MFGDGAGAAYSFVAAEVFWRTTAVEMRDELVEESVRLPAKKCRTLRDVGFERDGTSGPI